MKKEESMLTTWRRRGVVFLALIALVVATGLCAGCGDSDEASNDETDTTTTTEATVAGGSTMTTEIDVTGTGETLVVDGASKEEYEASLADLEAVVAAAPNNLELLQELAIAQFQTGRLEEAAATYEKMLEIKDDAFTRNNYANVLRDMGRTEEAKTLYEEAMAADPTLVHPYVNLAHLLIDEGDGQGALEFLTSALDKVTGEDKTSIQSFIDRLTQATATT